ncbi:MAG: hypothetical protein JWN40_3653 [Phycisphaerales bacterium]|nr:hypothetical protein [Phycisphaerales bacterium]
MNPSASSTILAGPLFLGILLVHVAAFLIRYGWFPRGTGKAPHCRRCGYSLEGIQTDRCPECGNFLTSRTIVKGRRVRRKSLAFLGIIVALIGIGCTTVGFKPGLLEIDWDAHKPLFWVLHNFESTDAQTRDRAWLELTRRFATHQLSDADKAKLDAAIVRIIARSGDDAFRNHVVARYAKLSDAQKNVVFTSLLADLQGNNYVPVVVAGSDLDDLMGHALLSPSQLDQLEQLALGAQAASARSLAIHWLLNFLGDRAAANQLAPAHHERFFTQAMSPSLKVRQEMIAGQRLPFSVHYGGKGPDRGWWSRDQLLAIAVDDNPPQPQGSSITGNGFMGGASGGSIAVEQPGKHVVHVTLKTSAFVGAYPAPDEHTATPFWSRTITLSAPFLALPATTRDDITLIDDPAAVDAIRQSINVNDVRASDKGYDRLAMTIAIRSPPVNIAFEVFALYANKEHRIGSVYSNAGEDHNFGINTNDVPAPPSAIAIVLRASPTVARDTIDLYEIWNGTLTIPNLPVLRSEQE